jgi:hypothetical protein
MGAREGEVARRWYGNLLYGVHPRGRDDGDRGEEHGKAHLSTFIDGDYVHIHITL